MSKETEYFYWNDENVEIKASEQTIQNIKEKLEAELNDRQLLIHASKNALEKFNKTIEEEGLDPSYFGCKIEAHLLDDEFESLYKNIQSSFGLPQKLLEGERI